MKNSVLIHHSRPPQFEYSRITNHIYIGNNLCCTANLHKDLIKKNVEADLSLEYKKLDAPFGVKYYLWLPTKNYYAPSREQLIIAVKFIDFCVSNNIKVLVHCELGHTRAPTVVAAYFMSKGMNIKEAIRKVKKKRPAIHLTDMQKSGLKKFERLLESGKV